MNDQPVMINVTIEGLSATLQRVKPGKRGYDKARKQVIHRERDAIDLFNRSVDERVPLDGVYSFESVDIAKTFAFLHLKSIEHQVANNLDLVQAYDGNGATAG
ncbi:MAG TPA: hypothetical protein VIX81_00555 [Gammaproteobacteria bacterium]